MAWIGRVRCWPRIRGQHVSHELGIAFGAVMGEALFCSMATGSTVGLCLGGALGQGSRHR
jgi:hypothetical protein